MEVEVKCVHHWLLEEPSGTVSIGTCKKCKKMKDFYNSTEEDRNADGSWHTRYDLPTVKEEA